METTIAFWGLCWDVRVGLVEKKMETAHVTIVALRLSRNWSDQLGSAQIAKKQSPETCWMRCAKTWAIDFTSIGASTL